MRFVCPIRSLAPLTAALPLLAVLVGPASSLQAQTCSGSCGVFDSCRSPATAAPSSLWGDLEPTDSGALPGNRDSTDFNELGNFETHPYFSSVDIEENYLFSSGSRRIAIWDLSATPGSPNARSDKGLNQTIVRGANSSHAFFVWNDLDAPNGNSDWLATAGGEDVGIVLWDTSDKQNPRLLYQDHGNSKVASEVVSLRIGNSTYAFAVGNLGTGIPAIGARAYSFNAAAALGGGGCFEEQPQAGVNCPGVHLGQIGTRSAAKHIDGVDHYIVMSSGFASGGGFEIWNVQNPSAEQLRMSAIPGTVVEGIAMWKRASKYYVALRITAPQELRIYDVTCIGGASACTPTLVSSTPMPSASSPEVTYSISDGTPFLYVTPGGDQAPCNEQVEFLFDVSNPASPVDISPQTSIQVGGESVTYWSWYYWGKPTGFNRVVPRRGKFNEDYFYRAAKSILDVHRRTGGAPPVANFAWTPTEIYPGTGVNFTDSSSGNPNSWSWTFSGGSPGSSTQTNPNGVTFSTTGSKSVSLQVGNNVGSNSTSKTVQVLPPQPSIGGIQVSPNPALICQNVSFKGQNVTGQPPLARAWTVRNAQSAVVTTGGNVDPFVWNTAGAAAGTYTVELTATNGSGSQMATSPALTLSAPPPLPAAGTFAATNEAPASGTVAFHVNAPGATEWNWNFGDGTTTGWLSDPVEGPNPVHSYTLVNTYAVTVQVRNCLEGPVSSASLQVTVNNVVPLHAEFRAGGGACDFGLCAGEVNDAIPFTDLSSGALLWDYDWDGDGTFEISGRNSPLTTHTFNSTGTYSPRVRVRRGTESDTYQHPAINIGDSTPPPPPSVTVTGPNTGQVDVLYSFSATATNCTPSANGWTWTHSGQGTSSTNQIGLRFSSTGVKGIQVRNSACGSASGSRFISISGTTGNNDPNITANFTFNPSAPGVGESVSFDGRSSTGSIDIYTWNFGDGGTGNGATVSHTYNSGGNKNVTLEISQFNTQCSFGVCVDTVSKTVRIGPGGPTPTPTPPPPPVADFSYQVVGPATSTIIQFTDTSTNSPQEWEWDFDDDGTADLIGTQNPQVDLADFGIHSGQIVPVTLMAGNSSGSDSVTKQVEAGEAPPVPTAAFEVDLPCHMDGEDLVCEALTGQQVNFTNTSTGATNYVWSFGDGGTAVTANASHVFDVEDVYTVTLTASNGVESDQATVRVDVIFDTGCREDAETLCLLRRRFQVRLNWELPNGRTGAGKLAPLATDNTGLYYFRNPLNWEVLVKMVDGCATNGHYWVFVGGTTTVRYTVEVVDMLNGQMFSMENPQGVASPVFAATNAFETCSP